MKVVWRLGSATVRDVYEAMRAERTVAYTTVMTMMRILEDKGYLKKTLVEWAHVYKPTRARQQVIGVMVKDLSTASSTERPGHSSSISRKTTA